MARPWLTRRAASRARGPAGREGRGTEACGICERGGCKREHGLCPRNTWESCTSTVLSGRGSHHIPTKPWARPPQHKEGSSQPGAAPNICHSGGAPGPTVLLLSSVVNRVGVDSCALAPFPGTGNLPLDSIKASVRVEGGEGRERGGSEGERVGREGRLPRCVGHGPVGWT